ncbi:hypothetical protein [Psychrobacter sp. Sarcosine-3u-12]|uniref:hypothetical protein n=1 Tax=Psychrobacter sp. Sarcosine-3u-12 TaxID=2058325 RepID=UPI000C32D990|nr:hypothetical protein [Psychrobacter sp. Sarcosine-3u-12]PKG36453.1 hypothetical protein CXF65_02380 [Psychrobacter sp. Sarcosine-3u-12]
MENKIHLDSIANKKIEFTGYRLIILSFTVILAVFLMFALLVFPVFSILTLLWSIIDYFALSLEKIKVLLLILLVVFFYGCWFYFKSKNEQISEKTKSTEAVLFLGLLMTSFLVVTFGYLNMYIIDYKLNDVTSYCIFYANLHIYFKLKS